MTELHLIRHAHAGSRSEWEGDDEVRPLSKRGWRQAEAIGVALADSGIDLLWTSRYVRCRQTLRAAQNARRAEYLPPDIARDATPAL